MWPAVIRIQCRTATLHPYDCRKGFFEINWATVRAPVEPTIGEASIIEYEVMQLLLKPQASRRSVSRHPGLTTSSLSCSGYHRLWQLCARSCEGNRHGKGSARRRPKPPIRLCSLCRRHQAQRQLCPVQRRDCRQQTRVISGRLQDH